MMKIFLGQSTQEKIVTIIKIVVILMILWGMQKEPYIYYQTLRRFLLILTVYLAYEAYVKKQFVLLGSFVVTAILFNPIFHISLSRNLRQVLNILVVVELISTIIDTSIFAKYLPKK